MSGPTECLRELHRVHRQLTDLRDRLAQGPRQIRAREQSVVHWQAELKQARLKVQNAKISCDQKQLALKSGEAKIQDLRSKLNMCSSNREYQALQEQIAAAEMANSVLEDEILEALDKIEQLQVAAGQAEQILDQGKEKLEKTRGEVAGQTQSLQNDVASLEEELTAAERNLPVELREPYQRNVKERGEDGMAAVEDEVCSGCHTRITPNTLSELAMDRVLLCKSCGRLLYQAE